MMKILFKTNIYLFVTFISIYLISTIGGLIIKNLGQSQIDKIRLEEEGGKLATNEDGRTIEYFIYGINDPNAPVIINIHGSGVEGRLEKEMYQSICEELNVRGISISLPGFGNTDMKIGRTVVDWPAEDLAPVLSQEGVDTFMITGHSQGNPHAMAAAWIFGERCKGLGLYAPLLPNDLTQELGIAGATGYEKLKTTEQLKSPFLGWYFFSIYLTTDLFSPALPKKMIMATTEKLSEDTALVSKFGRGFERSTLRGSAGNAWELAKDVCYDWGFDPRLIETKNILPQNV